MSKLYILCGIPFSGKSFLAREIAKKKGFSIVDLDDIKFELYGKQAKDNEIEQKDWDLVYQEMYKRIENLLKEDKTVINDTGNFTKKERELVKKIADKLNIETVFIYIDTPKEVAYKRLLENRKLVNRFDVGDKDFESAANEMEPPKEDKNILTFHYNEDIDSWILKNKI
jgi:predicted kinase